MIRLKELRLEKGLNQKEFAEMVDTTQRNVSNWENGNSEPDIQMLLKMSKFFDVSVDYFLGNTENLVKIENGVETELLGVALTKLNDREREIMELRYGLGGSEEKTQREVADMLGISQSYISRLEKRIIVRLKKEFSKMV